MNTKDFKFDWVSWMEGFFAQCSIAKHSKKNGLQEYSRRKFNGIKNDYNNNRFLGIRKNIPKQINAGPIKIGIMGSGFGAQSQRS